jgi:hypothetical protein
VNSLSTKISIEGKYKQMKIRALVTAGLFIAVTSLTASAQFTISKSVIGSGGGPASGGGFQLNGTIGQAVVGPTSGAGFTLNQGFWYTIGTGLGVKELPGIASGYELGQNYPNPFNPKTNFRFSIPERAKVTVRIMNLLGEEVGTRPIDGVVMEAGSYEVDFLAEGIPSGTYVYRLEAGNIIKTRKMVLSK